MNIKEYLSARREYFDGALAAFLPPADSCPEQLLSAMKYTLFAGGKRLRPILAFAAVEGCGDQWEKAMPAAAALEMVHTYSLIHDDLPAMDDDNLRRGKPSCHKVFGEGMAILAGDALLTHAFKVLADSPEECSLRLALVGELARAAGPVGMVAGQALDITGFGPSDPDALRSIHRLKTGALIRAAVRMGAIVSRAGQNTLEGLGRYAESLGLAYQILDDVDDVTLTVEQLGKNPGSDERAGKETFITLHGLAGARELAVAEVETACLALQSLKGDFSALQELARYIGRPRV